MNLDDYEKILEKEIQASNERFWKGFWEDMLASFERWRSDQPNEGR